MGMSSKERLKSALELIFTTVNNFKDMTYDSPELEARVLSGQMMQIGLIAANALDVNDRDEDENGLTDTDRIDFIQNAINKGSYTGKVVARNSDTGRGFRLHETSRNDGQNDVREAIDKYIKESS